MKQEKRVVDLIYIEPQKDEKTLVQEYQTRIDFWGAELKKVQEQNFEQHFDSSAEDVKEIMAMRKFLSQFLESRLKWILESVKDSNLRMKYLKVLPPFTQKGRIKTLLLHFFQVAETEDKKSLVYAPRTELDKELAVLFDIYKLRKTIESLVTIQKALDSKTPFKSIYPLEKRKECLESLKVAFKLMFQMCIRKEYQQELYASISTKHISPEAILKRREAKKYLVYQHVIDKFNYRNHFFFIYFFPGMKAKIGTHIKEFRFNYLDFEVIKQEFLIDWMHSRLEGNPTKNEIYAKYRIGNKSVAELISENPAKEIEILQQLPVNVFNDITAEVNDKVSTDLKSGVTPLSDNHGEFAKVTKHFERAQGLARSSIEKLKSFVAKRASKQPPAEPVKPPEPPKPEPVVEPPEPPKVAAKPQFEIHQIKKKQIDFPYFLKTVAEYKPKLALIRVKMGQDVYARYTGMITKYFNSVNEASFIQRRTPKYEMVLPYHIEERIGDKTINHLLILGAEVRAKQLGMGYSSGSMQNTKAYTPYFVYGCDQEIEEFGKHIDVRKGRGLEFFEYEFTSPAVRERALEFFNMILDHNK